MVYEPHKKAFKRKIEGRTYRYTGTYSKSQADIYARMMRKIGCLVRVVETAPVKNAPKKRYAVYEVEPKARAKKK